MNITGNSMCQLILFYQKTDIYGSSREKLKFPNVTIELLYSTSLGFG